MQIIDIPVFDITEGQNWLLPCVSRMSENINGKAKAVWVYDTQKNVSLGVQYRFFFN